MNRRIALLLLSLSLSAPARAERLLMWGIHDRCERVPELEKVLERSLQSASYQAHRLSPEPAACLGAECMQRVTAQCPQAQERLIGGRIYRNKALLRLRLWLHDPKTGKTAYQDAWCRDCLFAEMVKNQTPYLFSNPLFGAPGQRPTYCQESAPPRPNPRQYPRRVHLWVSGESPTKATLLEEARRWLEKNLYQVQLVNRESHKEPSTAELTKLTARRGEQVLSLSQEKDGTVKLLLFDGVTEKSFRGEFPCGDCGQAELVTALQTHLGAAAGHCFEDDCQRVMYEPVPAEACEPLPEVPECNEGGGNAISPSGGTSVLIDPKTARLVKGLTWGAVAATAGTAIALFASNAAGSGNTTGTNGILVKDSLLLPGLTAAGISVGLLGVAIPITLVANRAERTSAKQPSERSIPSGTTVHCP